MKKNNIMTAEQAYDRYLSDDGFDQNAMEGIPEAYKSMRSAFDCYLSMIEENEWRQGYNYALKMMKEGAV